MRFVDTNVLLYAASILREEEAKRRRARELLAEPNLAVSVQVLQDMSAEQDYGGIRVVNPF